MMKACDYKNAKREVLIHGVFSMWVIGAFIPIVVTRDAYYQNLLPGYGQEYADTLMAYMPDWILPVLLIAFVSFATPSIEDSLAPVDFSKWGTAL